MAGREGHDQAFDHSHYYDAQHNGTEFSSPFTRENPEGLVQSSITMVKMTEPGVDCLPRDQITGPNTHGPGQHARNSLHYTLFPAPKSTHRLPID